ncbi:unnamed protein product [Brassica oleracea]
MERLGSICLRTRLLSQGKKIMKKKKRGRERERLKGHFTVGSQKKLLYRIV